MSNTGKLSGEVAAHGVTVEEVFSTVPCVCK